MPKQPPERGDLSSPLIAELTPLVRDVDERIDVDDHTWRVVRMALVKAIMDGARIGAAEIVAQAVEHGVNMQFDLRTSGQSLDELIAGDEAGYPDG